MQTNSRLLSLALAFLKYKVVATEEPTQAIAKNLYITVHF